MLKRTSTALLAATSAAALLGTAAPAFAQSPAPTTESGTAATGVADSAQDDGLKDIIVTALKTSETASRTPAALSVFSGDTLKEQGVVSVADLRNLAPSVEIGNAAQGVNIAIRGVQTTDFTSKGEQGVGFSVDSIPIGRPQVIGLGFFDLERVEVLRGPQGTLYGKSATGGAINVITAKPKDAFDAAASIELGNFNTRRAEAMVNVPVSDGIALRVAASFNKRDGYLYPVLKQKSLGNQPRLNDEDNWAIRASALAKLGDNGSLVLTGTVGHVGGTGNVNNGALYYRVIYNGGAKYKRQVYYNPMAGFLDDDFTIFNGELNYDLGPVHLTYDGARIDFKARDNKSASTGDPAGAAGTPNYTWAQYDADISTDSHEVRLSNTEPGAFTWVIGANYINEKIDEQDKNWQTIDGPSQQANGTTVNCVAPTLSNACNAPNPHILGLTSHKSEGVFGQASFAVTHRFKVTGGLRYSHDQAQRRATLAVGGLANTFKDANGNVCAPPNGCIGGPNVGGFKGSKLTWRAGADFQITPDQLLYASVSTGYKAGSFNDFDPVVRGAGTYGAEELVAYEVGYKGKIMPTLQYNTSAYYYDYSKFQLTGATFLTPNITGGPPQVVIYTTSVPAELYGWENELNWRPSRNDTVGAGFTLEHGAYSGKALVGFIYSNRIDFNGKRLDRLPTFTARINYEHRFPLASGAYFSARVTSKYSSSYVVSDLGGSGNPFAGIYDVLPQQYKQGSFTRTDLNVGYTSENGKFSLDVFVRNLENDLQLLGPPQGINSTAQIAAGQGNRDRTTVRISDPRFFGARLALRY